MVERPHAGWQQRAGHRPARQLPGRGPDGRFQKARTHRMRPGRVRLAPPPALVIPSDRWRPMRRVTGVAWEEQHHGEPRRVRLESEDAEWPEHGDEAKLVKAEETSAEASATGDEAWEILDEDET